MKKSGFALKRAYPGKKGFYLEFFTSADAKAFHTQGVANGSRIEMQDQLTVIMKFSEEYLTDAS